MTWNLGLLYPGFDSKEFLDDLAAVSAGIDAAQAEWNSLSSEIAEGEEDLDEAMNDPIWKYDYWLKYQD